MVRGIAIFLLLVAFPVCFAQNSFSSYVSAPAAKFTYATSTSPATTGVVVLGGFALTGTANGRILFRNVSAAVNTSASSSAPDYWLQVTSWPVTSLWMQSATTFGFISNDTIAVYNVATRTPVWSYTASWGQLDITSPNTYIQTWDPLWLNSRIYVGSYNTSANSGSNPNSTIYAFDGMTGLVWATSVTNAYSNYLMSGSATDGIVVARTSQYGGSSLILALNATTGALLPFQGTSSYGASSTTPLFVYYNWRVFAVVGNGYFQSFSIADSSSTTQYSLSCSSGSNMLPPALVNTTVYFTCAYYVYAFTADNATSFVGSDSTSYTITMWTQTPDGSKGVVGTYEGSLYWYFPQNTSLSSAFYNPPSYSIPVVGFSWISWTQVLVSFGSGSYYGRVQLLDLSSYRIVWTFDDGVTPLGPAWPVQTQWGWFVFTSSAYDVGTSSTYLYNAIQGVLLNSTGAASWALGTYYSNSFYSGAIYLNTTIQLLLVVDTYGFAYGINATTGTQLFRSSSNCDSSTYGSFIQVGDNMCWQYSDYLKCINWVSAAAASGTTSCTSLSTSQSVQYGSQLQMTTSGHVIAEAYYSVIEVNPSTVTQLNNYRNTYTNLAGTTTTDTSYAYTPAVWGTKIWVVQSYSIGGYDTSATTPTTALWSKAAPSFISTTSGYVVTFITNAVIMGSNVYTVGLRSGGSVSGSSYTNVVYCYSQTSGSDCGTTTLAMTSSQWILAANDAIFVFGTSNFSAVAGNGGSIYYTSNVSASETIYTYAMNQPTVSSAGFLGISTYSTVYTFNGWTGQLLWSYPTGGASGTSKTQQASNGLVYWSTYYRNYASQPLTGEIYASWAVGGSTGYSTQGYAVGNGGWFYSIQSSTVYGTPTPMLANVTGVRAPGHFAPSNWLLDAIKKNKLWIIAVVVGILVIAVIGFLVTRNKKGDGQKDESYVSMNAQGARV